MKIILSRKGFDSSAGGVPSPIFPDGRMLSLPIPDRTSAIAYREVAGNDCASVGELVEQLAGISPEYRAHLDPDLSPDSIPRAEGWRPIFGQEGAAEGHLANRGVGPGDLFLFFGLFRPAEKSIEGWRYVRGSRSMHIIFGWLQTAKRIAVSNWPSEAGWALYHPHFRRQTNASNVVYVSTERLSSLPGVEGVGIAGAGLFPSYAPRLQLTKAGSRCPSHWLLPEWFHPEGRMSALSYHADLSRWTKFDAGVMLTSVSKGQEFVLDCDHYPEAIDWLKSLLLPCR